MNMITIEKDGRIFIQGVEYKVELCTCEDCQDSVTPCACDCDRESECQGCKDARKGKDEELFHIDLMYGRR